MRRLRRQVEERLLGRLAALRSAVEDGDTVDRIETLLRQCNEDVLLDGRFPLDATLPYDAPPEPETADPGFVSADPAEELADWLRMRDPEGIRLNPRS